MQQTMEHQAWILRSLLAKLEKQEAEGEDSPNSTAGEFARLKSQSTKYRTDRTYTTKEAEKQDNVKKNRYKDIVPFDHSRVKLTLTTSKNDADYINANFIKGVSGSRTYIATQGPLPHTVLDFLRMLWEYGIKVVIMACREFEMGKKKCERYWPEKPGQRFVCEPFTVYCDSEENKEDYLSRTLRVTFSNCSRTMKQLHYVTWPDHGVPDTIPPILEMLDEMRASQGHDDAPICVHCSAGCGRTGALCVIDYTWNLLKKQIIPPDFSIFGLVQNMRTQRPSLVQTKEQYQLVYRTIKLLFEQHLQDMDAQACKILMTAAPRAAISLGEDFDLQPQLQPKPSQDSFALNNHTAMRDSSPLMDRRQWELLQTLSESLATSGAELEGAKASPDALYGCEGDVDEATLTNPPPDAVAAAICLMVEDPYFDGPASPPPSQGALADSPEGAKEWMVSKAFSIPTVRLQDHTLESAASGPNDTPAERDEEAAPPLPQRTPESYVLAVDAEHPELCERLTLIIPPNAAAAAVRELGGSPPSPVPPLPERTPESFEISDDRASVEQRLGVTSAENLSRIGTSSEWCGDSKAAATGFNNDMKPWTRSKSVKANMRMSAAVLHPELDSNATSNLPTYCPPVVQPTAPLLPHTEQSVSLPLPVSKTPESLALTTGGGGGAHSHNAIFQQPPTTELPLPRVGLSSEWGGSSRPVSLLLDEGMSRSKSVRAKSSRQEPLAAVQQLTPLPVVVAEGGSALADVNHRSPLTDTTGNRSGKDSEKGMSRTRSLKFFKSKQKSKAAPPQPTLQPPPYSASSSLFKFGFGLRFGKPKGPRSYPETWV